jgi:ribosomal protein L11 methylase PrmA
MVAEMRVPGSFRDPSGHVFVKDGVVYRAINPSYRPDYERLLDSGLYRALTDAGLLVAHEEVLPGDAASQGVYKTIRPEPVRFISYPYEWCFSQLRDAALATLGIQKTALEHDLSLKDCSAYNIQYHEGRPVLIDTLSFERYREGQPWPAYRQFCQHFLAPLAVMAMTDQRLNQLLRIHLDGLPLDLASALLPLGSRFRFGTLLHLHLHARSQARYADRAVKTASRPMRRVALQGLIDSLESAVAGIRCTTPRTTWGDYYENTNYSPDAFAHKSAVVGGFLDSLAPATVWDLGANDGTFSRIASGRGAFTVSFDLDQVAVEKNYRSVRESGERRLLPLLIDLSNPSPALGWAHTERLSLAERGPADVALALGLVHHLAIGNNLPLVAVAAFFRRIANALIVEFVPKSDSQTRRLLRNREDVFPAYDQQGFETAFRSHFRIESAVRIRDSERTLYAMRAA